MKLSKFAWVILITLLVAAATVLVIRQRKAIRTVVSQAQQSMTNSQK
jgi:hypothetical protein